MFYPGQTMVKRPVYKILVSRRRLTGLVVLCEGCVALSAAASLLGLCPHVFSFSAASSLPRSRPLYPGFVFLVVPAPSRLFESRRQGARTSFAEASSSLLQQARPCFCVLFRDLDGGGAELTLIFSALRARIRNGGRSEGATLWNRHQKWNNFHSVSLDCHQNFILHAVVAFGAS